ncbi:MAG: hypothetical protein ACR2OU_12960, partial [Thermomicrobiales bacterium]
MMHAHAPLSNALSRRTVLQGSAVAGLAGIAARHAGAQGATPETAESLDWQQFDDTLQAAMEIFDMVGAAVAVVDAKG